jgi:SSS family solute:Na+ symporter
MLVYSEIGGLRAIMYSDVMQGLMLLGVVWVVAIVCVGNVGGLESLFREVASVDDRLLSVPGPRGLFTVQFLAASFFAVLLLPVTQPQLTTRLMVIKDQRKMNRMAVAIGCFVILILVPVALIGMYGAARYPGAGTRDFLAGVLLTEQSGFIAAAAVVGLLAAAMSTADSQIFALGTELRSLLSGEEKLVLRRTKWALVAFGAAAMVFSVLTSDQLVLLARVSFSGTALMAPMILAGVVSNRRPGFEVIMATGTALIIFILSLLGIVPEAIGFARLDLALLLIVAALTALSSIVRLQKSRSALRS